MAIYIQFTRDVLPEGFSLNKEFVSHHFGKTLKEFKGCIPGPETREVFAVTGGTSKFTPVFLTADLEKELALDSVVDKIKGGSKILAVDGIWMPRAYDKAIIASGNPETLLVAECSGKKSRKEYVFCSAISSKEITLRNFKKIVELLPEEHSTVRFSVITFSEPVTKKISEIVKKLGYEYEPVRTSGNARLTSVLFGPDEEPKNLIAVM